MANKLNSFIFRIVERLVDAGLSYLAHHDSHRRKARRTERLEAAAQGAISYSVH